MSDDYDYDRRPSPYHQHPHELRDGCEWRFFKLEQAIERISEEVRDMKTELGRLKNGVEARAWALWSATAVGALGWSVVFFKESLLKVLTAL